MKSGILFGRCAASLMLLVGFSVSANAARPAPQFGAPAEDHDQVEMFEAIAAGDIEVDLIPKNAKEANVIFRNKTDKPLAIKLPEAFAGVPALAQFGGGFGGNQGGFGGNQGGFGGGQGGFGGNQGLGGGFGGGQGGFGGNQGGFGGNQGGFGGGFMNVGPAKMGKLHVPAVCLEHGKTDPNPRVEYKIIPINEFTENTEIHELCKMVGRGEIPQNTAQAVAWHVMDGLSWDELSRKDRVRLRNGYTEKFFAPQELRFAMQVQAEAIKRAKANASATPVAVSPGE